MPKNTQWIIKNMPKDHPARVKLTTYAKQNGLQLFALMIYLSTLIEVDEQ